MQSALAHWLTFMFTRPEESRELGLKNHAEAIAHVANVHRLTAPPHGFIGRAIGRLFQLREIICEVLQHALHTHACHRLAIAQGEWTANRSRQEQRASTSDLNEL